MHTIINPLKSSSVRRSTSVVESFRHPHYECDQQGHVLKIAVYVPGVDAAGVEIVRRGPDLIVTARKSHFVRVNWQSLHLEGAQRDYRLSLRLGNGFDYDNVNAEIADGVLTLSLPKRFTGVEASPARMRRVA